MTKPNIVLIVMDTARAANFSCYGYPETTTPNIDKIAKEGTLYQYAISPSTWTLPSHASLFTGLYPSEHGVTAVSSNNLHLNKKFTTLAEMLKNNGYSTVAFSNNPWISETFGFDKGFNEFNLVSNDLIFSGEMLLNISKTLSELEHQKGAKRYIEFMRVIFNGRHRGKNLINALHFKMNSLKFPQSFKDNGAKKTTKSAKKWVSKREKEKPFFMFINYIECHADYIPPITYIHKIKDLFNLSKVNINPLDFITGETKLQDKDFKIMESLYNGEIRYLDNQIGKLCNFLKHNGVLDETLLIITSDHGENFGEHGLMGHLFCTYNTLAHVPLIIRYPPLFKPNTIITKGVETLDVFNTIEMIISENTNENSLIPYILENTNQKKLISEYFCPEIMVNQLKRYNKHEEWNFNVNSIQKSKFKYVENTKGLKELYDIENDPAELQNIINDLPKIALELQTDLNKFKKPHTNTKRIISAINNVKLKLHVKHNDL